MTVATGKMVVYLVRRIKELKASNWTRAEILQQLSALAPSKQLMSLYESN